MKKNASSGGSKLTSIRTLVGVEPHRASFVLFLIGVLVTLLAFGMLRAHDRARERIELERRVAETAARLRSQLERPLEVLHSVCALFDASAEVDREEFARFARPALARHPGIRALEWIPVVPAAERASYENAARADGLFTFEFTEVAEDGRTVRADARPMHLPIYFMEPPDHRVLGFDLTSEPERTAPVERAHARRSVIASERMRLIEDPPTLYSIAVFCPVFTPVAARERPSLRGVGAQVFRLHEVVAPAVALAVEHGMHIVVLDADAPAETRLLFESTKGLGASDMHTRKSSLTVNLEFADRRWLVAFSRGPSYQSVIGEPPWWLIAGGIMLSALLGLSLSATRVILHLRRQVDAARHLGQYTLVRKLGEGGMGVVWEAQHAMLRRPTAIKLLRQDRAGDAAIKRFEREVQLTSQLTHPNTVAIYDYGHTADGVFYYVMEFLDGLDLQHLVDLDGPQPPRRIIHIMKQVASALAEAHARGLVHRDIKPANIVLCERGGLRDVAKVVDFGLVKSTAAQEQGLSADQALLGTPLFIAPEAITDPEHVDARSDIYACGAVIYFLLTGHAVFEAATVVEICSQHLYGTPIRPSDRVGHELPEAIEKVVMRCLAKNPSERFASAEALLSALSDCGLSEWTNNDARAAWSRVAGHPGQQAAAETARTLPVPPPSMLAVDLRRRDHDK